MAHVFVHVDGLLSRSINCFQFFNIFLLRWVKNFGSHEHFTTSKMANVCNLMNVVLHLYDIFCFLISEYILPLA